MKFLIIHISLSTCYLFALSGINIFSAPCSRTSGKTMQNVPFKTKQNLANSKLGVTLSVHLYKFLLL
jgi:hypothetical protein